MSCSDLVLYRETEGVQRGDVARSVTSNDDGQSRAGSDRDYSAPLEWRSRRMVTWLICQWDRMTMALTLASASGW